MADDFVDGSAAASRKVVVSERRRISVLRDNIVMHGLVNFLCCHSWHYHSMPNIECFSANFTRLSYKIDFLRWSDRGLLVSKLLKVHVRFSSRIFGIVRFFNVIRYRSPSSKRVWERPQRSSVFVALLNLLVPLFVGEFVHGPHVLKTLLRAEKRWLKLQLLAVGALQIRRLWAHGVGTQFVFHKNTIEIIELFTRFPYSFSGTHLFLLRCCETTTAVAAGPSNYLLIW